MKQFKILSLAILLSFAVTGLAFSAQIPDITQPTTGNEAWNMQVFNNSGAALDAGDVVIWDIDSSTNDEFMYVDTTETAGTGPIAGVVLDTIGISETGTITVYGYATVDTAPRTVTGRGTAMTTSATTGSAQAIVFGAGETYVLGHSLVATSSGSTIVFVNPSLIIDD